MRDRDLFVRLDDFEFEEFLQTALPALEALDRLGALALLSTKLDRALRATDEGVRYPGSSTTWCRDLDRADPVDGVIAQLARAVSGVAVRASADAEGTAKVFAVLERHDEEIFQRIGLRVLAAAGQNAKPRLDAFFNNGPSVEPSFRGRETAAVIREQFANASQDAREAFQRALELGPEKDSEGDLPEAEREERLGHWQRRRLLWFRDRLPDSLREMAARVGVTGDRPSPQEEALAEDGFYSSGGYVGERSPISVEELAGLNPEAFVEFLVAWRADISSWTSPTRDGLERMLTQYASTQPASAILRAQRLVVNLPDAGSNVAGYVQALLSGFRAAGEAGTSVDWSSVIGLIRDLLPLIEGGVRNEGQSGTHRPWKWLATETLDTVIAISRKNLIPAEHRESIWVILQKVMASDGTWETRDEEPFKSFEDVLMAALNTTAGRATEASLEAALAIYRQALGVQESAATRAQTDAAKAVVAPRLRPLLQQILSRSGRGPASALAVVGTYLPQIHLIDREWIIEVVPVLFDKGATEPLEHPAWGGYITRAPLFTDVFADIRIWYERAASVIPATLAASTERRGQWSLTQHLGEHVFGAYMRGMLEIDGDDQLLETTFNRLPAEERAHISWQIFRSWTDTKRPVRPEAIQRLVSFWRWRLDRLAALPESESKTTDVEGLTWLMCTPYLPDSVVLDLGLETVTASRGQAGARGAVWEHLARLAEVDINKTFPIAEMLITAALRRQYGHITLKQTEVVLSRALRAESPETRERAIRLINSLGERGYIEFGRLLKEVT